MKRVILLFIAIVFAWFVGCVKEAELPPLDFKFAVDSPNESFADKGVNEAVTLSFEVKADYYFSKVPMKYKIETDKDASISVGEKNILPNEIYTLENPKLSLSYVGKVAGQHNVKIIFFNGDTKKDRVTKEFKLKYVEYDYTLEELSGKHAVFQGESIDFEYKLTPKNGEDDGNYTITFKSYDEADVKLEKSKVLFNGEVITLNKSYAITDLSKFVIGVRPFHFGSKFLKYVIKNKTGQREGAIALEVKQNTLQVSGDLDKVPVGYKGEVINFVGKIKKEPLHVRSFKYKTVLTEGTPGGVELNDWKEVSYNNDDISIPIKVLENGSYQIKVTFQDEFGNETEKIISINSHANYKFRVEVEGGKNPFYQGEEVTYRINLVREDSRIAATYKIVFDEVVEGDSGEKATTIVAGGTKISGSTYLVQTDTSDPANVKYFVTVKVKSFSIGTKKLNFRVFRDAEGVEAEKVTGSIGFEVQKVLFKVEQELLDKNRVINISDVITHTAKIVKADATLPIKYKILITNGDKTGINDNDVWKEVSLDNAIIKIPIKFLKQGNYKYKIFYKDEYGNEIEGEGKEVIYKEKEDFKASFHVEESKIMSRKPFNFDLKIEFKNGHEEFVDYFMKFPYVPVTYNGINYNAGQVIPIKASVVNNIMSISGSIIYSNLEVLSSEKESLKALLLSFVSNSQEIEKPVDFLGGVPDIFVPFQVEKINLKLAHAHKFTGNYNQLGDEFHGGIEDFNFSIGAYEKDTSINTDDLEYVLYLKERKTDKMVILGNKRYKHDEIFSSSKTKLLYHYGFGFKVRNGRGVDIEKFEEMKYDDVFLLEVYYKGKKVYQISKSSPISGFMSHDYDYNDGVFRSYYIREDFDYVNTYNADIFYENYDFFNDK